MRKMVEHTYIRPGSLDDASQYLYDMKSHKPKTQNSNLARPRKTILCGHVLALCTILGSRQVNVKVNLHGMSLDEPSIWS
jgi:hypothetical protein